MLNGCGRRVRTSAVAVRMLAASVILIAAGTGSLSQRRDDNQKSTLPSSIAGSGKLATVTLTPDQQHQIGLQTAVLESAPHPEQIRAYGAVLDVARITDLTNSYANAQAQLQTAQAKFDVAKSAFERAQNLAHSAILAKRDAEAAEGTFRTDQASLNAAESQVKTLSATARQEWGPVIGKGIVERSPEVVQLIERDQFLVQVTLPPGVVLAEPPGAALAQAPSRNANIDLHYVSPATRTDARIQGTQLLLRGFGRQWLAAWDEHHRSMSPRARPMKACSSRTPQSCNGRVGLGCTSAPDPTPSSDIRSALTSLSPTMTTSCRTFRRDPRS